MNNEIKEFGSGSKRAGSITPILNIYGAEITGIDYLNSIYGKNLTLEELEFIYTNDLFIGEAKLYPAGPNDLVFLELDVPETDINVTETDIDVPETDIDGFHN